jgi:tetratricopeptide (TPR) repeat protein
VIKICPDDAKTREKIMYLQSQLPYIYGHRGRSLIELGNFNEAEIEIRKAISLNPNNVTAFRYAYIGSQQQAKKLASKCFALLLALNVSRHYLWI